MNKRKVFKKTDLSTPGVEHSRDKNGKVVIPLEVIPPKKTTVEFGPNATARRSHEFSPWYGTGIDQITYACQRQIERFLDGQDAEVEVATVVSYACSGLNSLLEYLTLRAKTLGVDLDLADINRSVIDDYIGFLRDGGAATNSQMKHYVHAKAVLKALCKRGLITEILAGDGATFPRNPYPNSRNRTKGEKPLPLLQRKAFTRAVKNAVSPIFSEDVVVTSELLGCALLIIALHTGRNTTPLLEMGVNCLRSHPKDNTKFLVLYKRRGHKWSTVAVRGEELSATEIDSLETVRPTVVALIERVIQLSQRLCSEAPDHLKDRIWLYRARTGTTAGQVTALDNGSLSDAIKNLVEDHQLLDADGKPLRVNVSRLRKTFVNRIYEILDGDVASTAVAAGNTAEVTSTSYLAPDSASKKNWKFLGRALVEELLTHTIGASERTPVGRCADPQNGDYAPKRDGSKCMSFLNCLRCRSYVVTGDDLHRVYSFYWRLLQERPRMDKRRWKQQFSHITRLIDQDVIAAGLANGTFKQGQVDAARERARLEPHPFWRNIPIHNMSGSIS